MPKKEHIHIVTDFEHKQALETLGRKHGSMTKAFESAINEIGNKTASMCDDCKIKLESEMSEKFREMLNVISFTGENIKDLTNYIKGDISVRELLIRTRQKAYEFGRNYRSSFNIIQKNSYDNLLASLEEYKHRTRLFKAIEADRFAHPQKIIARVNDAFKDLPILVATGLIGFLESFDFTFDIDIFQSDIILHWLNPETYPRGKIEEKILAYLEEAEQFIKPFLLRKGLVLIGPDLLDWFVENLFGHYMVPAEISYTFANLVVGEVKQREDPNEISKICIDTLRNMNIITEISKEIIDPKTFRLTIICVKPNICKLIRNGLTQILAKYGWKEKPYSDLRKIREERTMTVVFHYVGDDPSILDPLYINNFIAYQNQHFETLRVVAVDEFDDISKALYERDQEAFREIFHKQGMKIGNAVRQLARTPDQIRMIALQVIPQLIRSLKSPEDVSFFPEKSGFTIILKKLDILTLERLRALITGSLESFGYLNVKSKIIGNQVSWEYVRPFEVEEKTVITT